MDNMHQISPAVIDFDQIRSIIDDHKHLEISSESEGLIRKCRAYLDKKLSEEDKPFYGINTGFGSLYDCSISDEDLGVLQKNLVVSHACGQGEEVPVEIVRQFRGTAGNSPTPY